MVGWDQWHTLLAVFRHGTYAGAARALRVDATTVGRRVKLLERELGYDLLVREKDRLHPTGRCEKLLEHIETAAEALRGAEQRFADSETGSVWRELRMTAPPFLATELFAPAIPDLTHHHRIRIELVGTASKVMLPRREADIAIRIDDEPRTFRIGNRRIDGQRIGTLAYAVYGPAGRGDDLPWAGLTERYVRSTGSDAMADCAGAEGFRYQAQHFGTLREIVASGAARALLPCLMAERDKRLDRRGDIVLRQPLWMLSHRQDRDVVHLRAARAWIAALAEDRLSPD